MLWKNQFGKAAVGVVCVLLFSVAVVAQDSEFTYQGELTQDGNLANGSFNMTFSLWNAVVGGTQIDSNNVLNGVSVVDGKFNVGLHFGAESFGSSDRWLNIVVNRNTLSPRQPVTRTPVAIQTRGIFVDQNHEVGLGTTNPAARLDVVSDTADNGNNTARFSQFSTSNPR